MRGAIVFAEVGLDFDDATYAFDAGATVYEQLAEQVLGDEGRVPVVERAIESMHGQVPLFQFTLQSTVAD
jgi:hypothetical protein